jgi:hypothetical protein
MYIETLPSKKKKYANNNSNNNKRLEAIKLKDTWNLKGY